MRYIIKKAINRFPSGSMMLLTRKSVRSNTVRSNHLKSASKLDDRAAGIPAIKTINPEIHDTFLRECFPLAVKAATIISNKLKEEVSVAKRNKIKNKLKNSSPNGNWANTVGKTIKRRPGPSVGSRLKEKTTGKIASPANSETK